jgi:hypothetical protein
MDRISPCDMGLGYDEPTSIRAPVPMLVSREQLEQNFRKLDSALIRGRLSSADLSPEAREVALAELARREQAGEPVLAAPPGKPPPSSSPSSSPGESLRNALPGRPVMKVLAGLYGAFVLLCVVVMLFDPPWVTSTNSIGTGMLGGVAALALGLPWDLVLINFLGAKAGGSMAAYLLVCLGGAGINVAFFVWYFRQR